MESMKKKNEPRYKFLIKDDDEDEEEVCQFDTFENKKPNRTRGNALQSDENKQQRQDEDDRKWQEEKERKRLEVEEDEEEVCTALSDEEQGERGQVEWQEDMNVLESEEEEEEEEEEYFEQESEEKADREGSLRKSEQEKGKRKEDEENGKKMKEEKEEVLEEEKRKKGEEESNKTEEERKETIEIDKREESEEGERGEEKEEDNDKALESKVKEERENGANDKQEEEVTKNREEAEKLAEETGAKVEEKKEVEEEKKEKIEDGEVEDIAENEEIEEKEQMRKKEEVNGGEGMRNIERMEEEERERMGEEEGEGMGEEEREEIRIKEGEEMEEKEGEGIGEEEREGMGEDQEMRKGMGEGEEDRMSDKETEGMRMEEKGMSEERGMEINDTEARQQRAEEERNEDEEEKEREERGKAERMKANVEEEEGGIKAEEEIKGEESRKTREEEELEGKVGMTLKSQIEEEIMRRLEEELVRIKLEERLKQNLETEMKVRMEEEKLKMTEEMKRKLEEEMKYEIEREIKHKLEEEKNRMEEEVMNKIKQEMKWKMEEEMEKKMKMEEQRLYKKVMEKKDKERKRRKEEDQKREEERMQRDKQLRKREEELIVCKVEAERKRKEEVRKVREHEEAEEDFRRKMEGVRRILERQNIKRNTAAKWEIKQKEKEMGEVTKPVGKEEQRTVLREEDEMGKSTVARMDQLLKKTKREQLDVKQLGACTATHPSPSFAQPSSLVASTTVPTSSVLPLATPCLPTTALLPYMQKGTCPSHHPKSLHECPSVGRNKGQSLIRNELEAFYELFKMFSGPPAHHMIDIHSLCVGLRALEVELTEAQLCQLLDLLDTNSDGQVCFEDFLEFVTDTELFFRYFAQLPDVCNCSSSQKGLLTNAVFFQILAEILRLGKLSMESTMRIIRYYYTKKKGVGIKDQREKKADSDVLVPTFLGINLHRLVHYVDVLEPDENYVESPLTQEQVDAFREFYEFFDRNNQGNIDSFSLLKIMNSLSIYVRNQLVPIPLQFLAVNQGREVTFLNFLGIMSDTDTFSQFLIQEQAAGCQLWKASELFTTDTLFFDVIERSVHRLAVNARAGANITNYYHQKFRGSLLQHHNLTGEPEEGVNTNSGKMSREMAAQHGMKAGPRDGTMDRISAAVKSQDQQLKPDKRGEAYEKRFEKALQNPTFNTIFNAYSWTWKMQEAESSKRTEQMKKGKSKVSTVK